jgi:hypothetical protein
MVDLQLLACADKVASPRHLKKIDDVVPVITKLPWSLYHSDLPDTPVRDFYHPGLGKFRAYQ